MKVLFLGNSHTYMNDMPYLFRMTAEASSDEPCDVTMLAYSGRDLEWHRKEYFSLRFALLYGNYDYCVIQQAAHPFPPEETTMKNGSALISLCRTCGVQPVLYMTWAEKAYPENQQKMIDTYTRLAREENVLLAAAGIVWRDVKDRHPEIELFFKDGEHASPYGDFLIASVIYRTLRPAAEVKAPEKLIDFAVRFHEDFPEAELGMKRYFTPDQNSINTILEAVKRLV